MGFESRNSRLIDYRALIRGLLGLILLFKLIGYPVQAERLKVSLPPVTDILYTNFHFPEIPLSAHVVCLPRHQTKYQLRSMHARGKALGLATLTHQAKAVESSSWRPVAALNGDFYQRRSPYEGDPRGLQILEGDVISGPGGTASFWIDALDEPHLSVTTSQFQVEWPDGSKMPFVLNGRRPDDGLALYTEAMGAATLTEDGRELVLVQQDGLPWPPLRIGRSYSVQVRDIREKGNSRLQPDTMVLSIDPWILNRLPRIQRGDILRLTTAVEPELKGIKTALSGGPILIHEGKRQKIQSEDSDSYSYEESSKMQHHPRSALGWNEHCFFLVQIDGRQRDYSIGMTLEELTEFLLELGCREAMNLDGGGSSTLWYQGKVRNLPCDGYERTIANSLVVVQKKEFK